MWLILIGIYKKFPKGLPKEIPRDFSREFTVYTSPIIQLKHFIGGLVKTCLKEKIDLKKEILILNYKIKIRLKSAECRLSTLEPRAELARQLEIEIAGMKADISRIRAENALLADTNEIQAKIIKSRSCSPAYGLCEAPSSNTHEVTFHETVTHRSRSPSPICSGPCGGLGRCSPYQLPVCDNERTVETTTITHHRSVSPPCTLNRSRPFVTSRCSLISPLSPNHSTQVIRQDSLISRFNDLFTRDRMNAMDLLRHYSNFENNQRIIFTAVQV